MGYYYCEPKWHRGALVPAVYLITPLDEDWDPGKPSFATCERHAGRALGVTLKKSKSVRAREVSNASATPTRYRPDPR
jgi:hypothetical protein